MGRTRPWKGDERREPWIYLQRGQSMLIERKRTAWRCATYKGKTDLQAHGILVGRTRRRRPFLGSALALARGSWAYE